MAYGRFDNQALIKEAIWEIGVWTAPETIGTDNVDPVTKFTSTNTLGIITQGSQTFTFSREFAELLELTPAILARKDLTRKMFMAEATLNQINIDLLGLVFGFSTQPAYSITLPAKLIDIAHIGSDEPTQSTNGYLFDTSLVDGRRFYIGMYAGRVTSEDLALAFSGTEHVNYPIKLEAFVHPNFATGCPDSQKHYGFMVIDSAVVCV